MTDPGINDLILEIRKLQGEIKKLTDGQAELKIKLIYLSQQLINDDELDQQLVEALHKKGYLCWTMIGKEFPGQFPTLYNLEFHNHMKKLSMQPENGWMMISRGARQYIYHLPDLDPKQIPEITKAKPKKAKKGGESLNDEEDPMPDLNDPLLPEWFLSRLLTGQQVNIAAMLKAKFAKDVDVKRIVGAVKELAKAGNHNISNNGDNYIIRPGGIPKK